MRKFIAQQFSRFKNNCRGNVAMLFGLLSLPIAGFAGLAVDYSYFNRVKAEMQHAADSAALAAVAKKDDLNQQEIRALVQQFFRANGGEADVERRTWVNGRETVRDVVVVAAVRVDTFLMHLITGRKTQVLRVRSVARKAEQRVSGLEIALVMDNSNSMNYGASWTSIVQAAQNSLKKLESETTAGQFFATLVPFTDRVNIGTHRKNWLSKTDHLDDWEGCVEPLEKATPSLPYATDMGNPIGSFLPTVPEYWGTLYKTTGKRDCAEEITGPVDNVNDMYAAMRNLSPQQRATGRFDDALAWGWRSVSGKWQGKWNSNPKFPSNDKSKTKVVAFFTDGHTNINRYAMEQRDGEFGNNNGSKNLFKHFNDVCTRMKAEDIQVFIFHVFGNPHAESYFRECAGDNYVKVQNGGDWTRGFEMLSNLGDQDSPTLVR